MGDWKRICPACDAYTNSVGIAFRDGEPCPYCGLPADVVLTLDKAATKGASAALVEMAAKAEARANKAETEVARLRSLLHEIHWTAERAAKEELG